MNEQTLLRLRQLFRSSNLVPGDSSAALILLLLVWLQRAGTSPSVGLDLSPQQLAKALEALAAEHPVLAQTFLDSGTLQQLTPVDLTRAVDLARQLFESADGRQSQIDLVALPALLDVNAACDPSLATLISRLLEPEPGDLVYVPWDATGQFSAALAALGARVVIETPASPVIAMLIGMLHRDQWQIKQANPILAHSKVDQTNPEGMYNSAATFLPLGMRFDLQWLDQATPGRFPERTSSAAVLGLRQLLAVTKNRIVVAVQNKLLFSSGAEHSLRTDLLQRGLLRTVIAMPAGLLQATHLAFSVLVIDPRGGNDQVRFINADSQRFKASTSRNRSTLLNISDLVQMNADELDGPEIISVARKLLLKNDAQLQVNRYVLPENIARAQAFLASANTVALEDLVTLVRPPSVFSDRDQADGEDLAGEPTMPVFEIGASDLPEFAYIAKPGRRLTLNAKDLTEAQFLQPHDIVLIVKGSVGKIGIVCANDQPEEPRLWIAGQSAIVLRVRENARIDPRALFMQLRSPLGQELLKGIVTSATISLIQLRELKRLTVIAPEPELERQAIDALEGEAISEGHITEFRREQADYAKNLWQLT
jgi:type I restriction enzyme M protein